jgi:hypothetical protein
MSFQMKTKVKHLFWVLSLIIGVGVLVFLLLPKNEYKTFHNSEYGFSFDYPRDWNPSIENNDSSLLTVHLETRTGSMTGEPFLISSVYVSTPEWYAAGSYRREEQIRSLYLGNEQATEYADSVPSGFAVEKSKLVDAQHGGLWYVLMQRGASDKMFQHMVETFRFSK